MKKSVTTQELVNIYPEWAKIRTNHQSVGFQLFNALALPMEKLDRQLETMKRNQFLTTVNLDEIDVAFRVVLPRTFVFATDNSDPTNPAPIAPTVRGYSEDTASYVDIDLAADNNIQSFWYDSVPNRATLDLIASGDYVLLSQVATAFPWSGIVTHHLSDGYSGGGKVWITTGGGTQYVRTNEDTNKVERGRITLRGTTRKGTEEEEQLAFPWNEKQVSLKEWSTITSVDVWDMEDEVELTIQSADFNSAPYWSFYNLRVSENRTKVDEFWEIDSADSGLLNRVGMITDEWQQALLGFSDKETKESWELLDESNEPVLIRDIAIQPFSNRAWAVSDAKVLYCYDLDELMVTGVNLLQGRTEGPNAQLEIEKYNITLGEDIVFTPWHVRTLKEIINFRVWFQDPLGVKWSIDDGEVVAYDSTIETRGSSIARVIAPQITFTPVERGDYLCVLETDYVDGTSSVDRAIITVQYKTPLTSIDLSTLVSEDILGIDFDADQKLWLRGTQYYYQIGLHADTMLIDYTNKVLYFKERYTDVEVTV